MRKDGKKNLLYSFLFFFLFGGKFRCKPHSMHVTKSVRITACSKLSARTLFFLLALSFQALPLDTIKKGWERVRRADVWKLRMTRNTNLNKPNT